ncbi:MAG: alpha/beta hydrolase [Luteibacter sp.]|uniref:alpha/beta fold hydrolase n=1 Tax=Luteibacter sp. TaxID=1886636 RepID=UPI0028091CB8|nr:alpha/beta hydrolase [Luteibacter sp.]MDQ7995217.1 alpha/beta hydrolase [Luteibacter sp.]
MRNFFRMVCWCAWLGSGAVLSSESVVRMGHPPLAGMLTDSGAGSPVVLLIPGSGPTDHDGNSPLGVSAQPYRLLAQALAAHHISVVRVDKRGLFLSRSASTDPNRVTMGMYAKDVIDWAARLSQSRHVHCVWVLGHSEGSQVAMLAARTDPRNICGLILVSAPGRPGWAVLTEQLHERLLATGHASDIPSTDAAIEALRDGQPVQAETIPAAIRPLFRTDVQAFLIDWFRYDPPTDLAASSLPTLVIEGSADQQVEVADGSLLSHAREGVQLRVVEHMNHVWKASSGDARADLATYRRDDLPIVPELAEAIVVFIRSHAAQSTTTTR